MKVSIISISLILIIAMLQFVRPDGDRHDGKQMQMAEGNKCEHNTTALTCTNDNAQRTNNPGLDTKHGQSSQCRDEHVMCVAMSFTCVVGHCFAWQVTRPICINVVGY